jgi:hypothetical protein
VCGLAAKADNAGFQPGFELPGRQVKKDAEPAYRGAPKVVRAASGQRNGIEPERVGARQRCVSRRLARNNAGYVSISQHHIVLLTHRKTDPDRVLFNWSDAAPCRSPASARWIRSAARHNLFVPVYHLFTEGFDTLDVKDAKLSEELAACFRRGRSWRILRVGPMAGVRRSPLI